MKAISIARRISRFITSALLVGLLATSAHAAGFNANLADGRIYGPDGKLFVMRGTNLWPSQPDVSHVVDCWKFNTIRVDYMPQYYNTGQLDNIVAQFTPRNIVVILDYHLIGGFGEGQQSAITSFLTTFANKYKNNPYVWLEIYNEPGGMNATMVNGVAQFNQNDVNTWINLMRTNIQAIRNAGFTNPIIVGTLFWGQDILIDTSYNPQFSRPWTEISAIIKYGHTITNGFNNIIFDMHNYDNFSKGGDFGAYLTALEAAKLPIFFGEYGSYTDHGYESMIAVRKMFAAMSSHIINTTVFTWDAADTSNLTTANSGGGQYVNSCTNPTNLTELGNLEWMDNRASLPPSSTPTSTPTPAPTPTPVPTPVATTSPNGATTAPGGGALVDSAGNKIAVNTAAKITVNGVVDNGTGNVVLLVAEGGVVHQINTAGGWWKYVNNAWVATTDPRPATSPDGTTTAPGGAALVDSTGNKIAINTAAKIAVNGTVDNGTGNVVLLVAKSGVIYQTNVAGGWWKYVNNAWIATTDPRPAATSSNGATATPGGVTLIDAAGNRLSINTSGKIIINGRVDAGTGNVTLLVAYGGSIYQSAKNTVSGAVGWWKYTGNGWTQVTGDPRPAPKLNVIYQAENMLHTNGPGISLNGLYNLWSNGYVEQTGVNFPSTGSYVFDVRAKADIAGGVGAAMEVRVDGVKIGSAMVTSLADYVLSANVTAGTHKVEIAFTNNAFVNGQDRNLWLDSITIHN